jgi:hypothetical protein
MMGNERYQQIFDPWLVPVGGCGMNKCRHKDDCINYGSFDYCIRENTVPITCSHYIKEHQENPLSTITTADLIAELERRWECITATKVYRDEEFNWSKWGNSKDGAWYQFDSGRVKGTDAYILVISGVE